MFIALITKDSNSTIKVCSSGVQKLDLVILCTISQRFFEIESFYNFRNVLK